MNIGKLIIIETDRKSSKGLRKKLRYGPESSPCLFTISNFIIFFPILRVWWSKTQSFAEKNSMTYIRATTIPKFQSPNSNVVKPPTIKPPATDQHIKKRHTHWNTHINCSSSETFPPWCKFWVTSTIIQNLICFRINIILPSGILFFSIYPLTSDFGISEYCTFGCISIIIR